MVASLDTPHYVRLLGMNGKLNEQALDTPHCVRLPGMNGRRNEQALIPNRQRS